MTKATGAFRDCSNAPKNGQHKYSNVFRHRVFFKSHCRAASIGCVQSSNVLIGKFESQLKGKACPRTGREAPGGGVRNSCTLSLTSALYEGGQRLALAARWTPGPVWTGAGNPPPPGIRSSDLPRSGWDYKIRRGCLK